MEKIIFILISLALLIGLIYFVNQEEKPFAIQSTNEEVVQIEEDTIYVLQGTTIDELLTYIESASRIKQTYTITTNEGNDKQKQELYSFDLLHVESKSTDDDRTYKIMSVTTFD